MLYNLSENTKNKLLELPETGFGYQVVGAVVKKTGLWQKYVVFNAEIAIEFDANLNFYTNTLVGYCYQMLLDSLSEIELIDIKLSTFNDQMEVREQVIFRSTSEYVRPTIFLNDNRIDLSENCLIPGSCITSFENYNNLIKTGKDLFNTYALPHQEEIKRIYYFAANHEEIINLGEFYQCFGKSGGGEKFRNTEKIRIASKNSIFPLTDISPSFRKRKVRI